MSETEIIIRAIHRTNYLLINSLPITDELKNKLIESENKSYDADLVRTKEEQKVYVEVKEIIDSIDRVRQVESKATEDHGSIPEGKF